jgi:hypothetical protein
MQRLQPQRLRVKIALHHVPTLNVPSKRLHQLPTFAQNHLRPKQRMSLHKPKSQQRLWHLSKPKPLW